MKCRLGKSIPGLQPRDPGLNSNSGTNNVVTLKPLPFQGPGFLPYETETRAQRGRRADWREAWSHATCRTQGAPWSTSCVALPSSVWGLGPPFLEPRLSTQSPSAWGKVMLSECRL